MVKIDDVELSRPRFQCSSASRKFLNSVASSASTSKNAVSVLFSEPKISQSSSPLRGDSRWRVSVLFSEPKISQFWLPLSRTCPRLRFSALQRAENFSIRKMTDMRTYMMISFSALQRAENFSIFVGVWDNGMLLVRFSALQRAENFSILRSRRQHKKPPRFSALQRAENFSIAPRILPTPNAARGFSALQRAENFSIVRREVLQIVFVSFSALQRAENFSMALDAPQAAQRRAFQCSSASRKFLNLRRTGVYCAAWRVSVLFSEPKISQSSCCAKRCTAIPCFSALQRAENFSI